MNAAAHQARQPSALLAPALLIAVFAFLVPLARLIG